MQGVHHLARGVVEGSEVVHAEERQSRHQADLADAVDLGVKGGRQVKRGERRWFRSFC